MELDRIKNKISNWQVLGLYGLFIGLAIGLYFVGRKQLYQSKADIDVAQTFTVTDGNNQPVTCSGTTCTTNSDDITIQFNESQAQDLLNALP